MDDKLLILAAVFFAINLVAWLIMLVDKNRSKKKGTERISEGILFFMAAAFGSFGVWLGMFSFHHKTHKWYFAIGIPLLMIQNCAIFYLVYINFAKYF